MPEYANYQSKVHRWCTIQVAGHSYSVPSRLIGKEVQIRLYADWVEVYYQGHLVERMERVHGEGEANVNYRHVIAGQSRLILVRGKIPGSSSSGSLTSPENGQLQHKRREFQRVGGLSITFKPQTRANVISD